MSFQDLNNSCDFGTPHDETIVRQRCGTDLRKRKPWTTAKWIPSCIELVGDNGIPRALWLRQRDWVVENKWCGGGNPGLSRNFAIPSLKIWTWSFSLQSSVYKCGDPPCGTPIFAICFNRFIGLSRHELTLVSQFLMFRWIIWFWCSFCSDEPSHYLHLLYRWIGQVIFSKVSYHANFKVGQAAKISALTGWEGLLVGPKGSAASTLVDWCPARVALLL